MGFGIAQRAARLAQDDLGASFGQVRLLDPLFRSDPRAVSGNDGPFCFSKLQARLLKRGLSGKAALLEPGLSAQSLFTERALLDRGLKLGFGKPQCAHGLRSLGLCFGQRRSSVGDARLQLARIDLEQQRAGLDDGAVLHIAAQRDDPAGCACAEFDRASLVKGSQRARLQLRRLGPHGHHHDGRRGDGRVSPSAVAAWRFGVKNATTPHHSVDLRGAGQKRRSSKQNQEKRERGKGKPCKGAGGKAHDGNVPLTLRGAGSDKPRRSTDT